MFKLADLAASSLLKPANESAVSPGPTAHQVRLVFIGSDEYRTLHEQGWRPGKVVSYTQGQFTCWMEAPK